MVILAATQDIFFQDYLGNEFLANAKVNKEKNFAFPLHRDGILPDKSIVTSITTELFAVLNQPFRFSTVFIVKSSPFFYRKDQRIRKGTS